jgi:Domain of unknown function DUF302
LVPPLRTEFLTSLRQRDVDDANAELQRLADLSIFLVRDHGEILRIAGQSRNALQYEIGNPLTASSMTRHNLAAALYAPLRVVLYETENGASVSSTTSRHRCSGNSEMSWWRRSAGNWIANSKRRSSKLPADLPEAGSFGVDPASDHPSDCCA